ncbi:zf-TFIIB domain-containing protein [Marinactinospora thermotolerans]|uniref:TFIIB-type zinc ribbon-containing protein n=1 Tax=Marinactinospora thermotolerans TaxID=531310 RepID=UPI003D8BE86C
MMTFDRMGIHIEQCERCRGIFLDAGELEQITAAEQRHYGGGAAHYGGHRPDSPAPYRGRPDSPAPYRGRPDSPAPYGYGHGYPDSPKPYGHRRKSFLGELFD